MIEQKTIDEWETDTLRCVKELDGGAILYPNNQILSLIQAYRESQARVKELEEPIKNRFKLIETLKSVTKELCEMPKEEFDKKLLEADGIFHPDDFRNYQQEEIDNLKVQLKAAKELIENKNHALQCMIDIHGQTISCKTCREALALKLEDDQ